MSATMDVMDRTAHTTLDERDHVVVLHGVGWEGYDAIDAIRGPDNPRPRLAYLEGELEIMTTGRRHELVKKLLARLIEAYADECEIELIGAGSTTFRKKAKEAGAEPDECYWLRDEKDVPDLAIEIVHTSGGIDKLEVYRRLGVREVWFWIRDDVAVYRLVGQAYRRYQRSVVVGGIDLDEIAELLRTTEVRQQAAVARA